METLLTASLYLLVIGFAALMTLDFISGLLCLFRTSAPPMIAQTKLQLATPQTEPANALSTQPQVVSGWDIIEPAGPEAATLSWLKQNMPPAEIYAVEMPNVIALAKVHQPKMQQPVALATREQLKRAGIRRCKKIASSLRVRNYNVMRLAQLVAVLEGKVTVSELVA